MRHFALAKKHCWKGQLWLESKLAASAGSRIDQPSTTQTHTQPVRHFSAPSFALKWIIIFRNGQMWTQIKSVLNTVSHKHTHKHNLLLCKHWINGNGLLICFSLHWCANNTNAAFMGTEVSLLSRLIKSPLPQQGATFNRWLLFITLIHSKQKKRLIQLWELFSFYDNQYVSFYLFKGGYSVC